MFYRNEYVTHYHIVGVFFASKQHKNVCSYNVVVVRICKGRVENGYNQKWEFHCSLFQIFINKKNFILDVCHVVVLLH